MVLRHFFALVNFNAPLLLPYILLSQRLTRVQVEDHRQRLVLSMKLGQILLPPLSQSVSGFVSGAITDSTNQ